MKDFVSKLTFGFLMAQLFPGAIAIYALTFAYMAIERNPPDSILLTADNVLITWDKAAIAHQLFLLGLCVGAGMLIHGVHWAVLGVFERRFGSVFRAPFHSLRLWKQVLIGPVRLIWEVLFMFVKTIGVVDAAIKDNAPDIHKDAMAQFEYIEDFYLYPAQFFSHMAYALTAACFAAITFCFAEGITGRRLLVLVINYVLVGTFFVIGRIHLRTLFGAEFDLVATSDAIRKSSNS